MSEKKEQSYSQQHLTSDLNDRMTVDNSMKVSGLERGQKDLGRNLDILRQDSQNNIKDLKSNTQKGFDKLSSQIEELSNNFKETQKVEQDHINKLDLMINKQEIRLKKVEDAVLELHDVNGKLRSIESRLDNTEKEVGQIHNNIADYKKHHYQSKVSIIIAIISAIGAIIAATVSCLIK